MMFNKVKVLALAAAITLAAPVGAMAAQINGYLGITGNIELASAVFDETGSVNVTNAYVTEATGTFSDLAINDTVTMSLLDFDVTPATVWSVGDYEFTVTAYTDFYENTMTVGGSDYTFAGFSADGYITKAGDDATNATMLFSTQYENGTKVLRVTFSSGTTPVPVPAAGLMLVTGLGGLAALRRRRKAA